MSSGDMETLLTKIVDPISNTTREHQGNPAINETQSAIREPPAHSA
jgi:hypothetical protein